MLPCPRADALSPGETAARATRIKKMSIAHTSSAPAEAKDTHARAGFWTLTLGSVGVVYGDIGTSPLYALKESLTAAAAGGALTREMVLGVMSLMLWALIVVVTLKYVLLIMRADNNGEGGTLTLMALLQRVMGRNVFAVTVLGMAGAALFYGDAIITPATCVELIQRKSSGWSRPPGTT